MFASVKSLLSIPAFIHIISANNCHNTTWTRIVKETERNSEIVSLIRGLLRAFHLQSYNNEGLTGFVLNCEIIPCFLALPLILQVNSNSKSGSDTSSDQGSYSRGLMAGLTVAMVLVILNIIGLLVYHRRRYAKYLNPFYVHYTSQQPFGQSNIAWLTFDLQWRQLTKRGFKPLHLNL